MSWLRRALMACSAAFALSGGVAWAAAAQWDFNGNLNSSTGGGPLVPEAAPPATAPDVTFTTATINGNAAQVASFSRGTFFRMAHGLAANGGGAFVNQYTLIIDVNFPDRSPSGGWAGLWQTSATNGNDGDWFINPDGGVGISGTYGGSVPQGEWHRLAFVSDLAAGLLTSYVDGVQGSQRTAQPLDGRHSLGAEALLFADEDGENSAGLVNSVRIVDRALTAAELLALGSPTGAGIDKYFEDDFNGYAADADLTAAGWQVIQANSPVENASWTVTNPGGRGNPPGENGSASSGKFVISDSDFADGGNGVGTGQSHDLITPAFKTTGAAAVWLHADCLAQLNDNGDAVFDVDVSTDGGAGWTNVFRRVSPSRTAAPAADTSNADGFFGRLHLDLSAVAADKPAVQVRFRHFEPTDDWWIALDNVLVDGVAPPQGGNCTVLGIQDFAGGLGSLKAISLAAPPNAGTETWHTTDKGNRYLAGQVKGRNVNRINHPNPLKEFVIMDSEADPDVPEDEYLATPVLNCFSFGRVFLHFKSEILAHTGATQEVLLSTDGGATFPHVILSYYRVGGASNAGFDSGEEPFYGEHVLSVPAAAGQAQVVFAFHYQSASGNAWWWALDDVQVTGDAPVCDPRPCGLRQFAAVFDPATSTVNGTWQNLPGDEGFQVFEGARQIGGDLPANANSFTDASPPPNGVGVVYTLKPLLGGVVERECAAPAIDTFACPSDLAARPNQVEKKVVLTWTPSSNVSAVEYRIFRNGEQIAGLGLSDGTFTDAPPLRPGELNVFNYSLEVFSDPAANPCSPLAARAIVSGGQVCFADDFDDYADDVALEFADWFRVDENSPVEDATWTVTNPGGRSHPPTFDGKPSTGGFAISDSDAAGGENPTGSGMSHDLWSPTFNCAGRASVWLHLDANVQLNNNGVAVFDVDVSTDGGLNWQNAYRRVAPLRTANEPIVNNSNADGFFGRLDVDLTALAASEPSVRFRLRHFEPNDDWWIAVDNVIVDDVPAPAGGSRTLFGPEEFAGSLGEMQAVSFVDPPNTGTETWHTTDKGHRYVAGAVSEQGVNRINHPNPDPDFAIMDSGADPDPVENEYLATQVIDCSLYTDIYLHWTSEILAVSGAVQEVVISLDGGQTAEPDPIFSYNGGGLFDSGEEPFYATRVIRVPQAAGQKTVLFAFHYQSPGNQGWWAIDDVKVTGNPVPPTAACEVLNVTAAAAADHLDVSWSIDDDADNDGVADCACNGFEVRRASGEVVASAPAGSTQVSIPGTCAEIVGGANGSLCVVCLGPSAAEKQACVELACGGRQLPGDCSQDGKLDITDVNCSLGYLFLGEPAALPCGDGKGTNPGNLAILDFNGDGELNISDPVGYLTFMFLGGGPPSQGTACLVLGDCPSACQ